MLKQLLVILVISILALGDAVSAAPAQPANDNPLTLLTEKNPLINDVVARIPTAY